MFFPERYVANRGLAIGKEGSYRILHILSQQIHFISVVLK